MKWYEIQSIHFGVVSAVDLSLNLNLDIFFSAADSPRRAEHTPRRKQFSLLVRILLQISQIFKTIFLIATNLNLQKQVTQNVLEFHPCSPSSKVSGIFSPLVSGRAIARMAKKMDMIPYMVVGMYRWQRFSRPSQPATIPPILLEF